MAFAAVVKQKKPGAATLTDIYAAVGLLTARVIGANQSAVATAVRVSIAPAGAADSPEQYIAYDIPIAGNGPFVSPTFACGPTDVVRVYNTLATVSFSLTGLENS